MQIRETATIEDLYKVPENGKAELINGELVIMSPTGWKSGRAGGRIYIRLDQFERKTNPDMRFPTTSDLSLIFRTGNPLARTPLISQVGPAV